MRCFEVAQPTETPPTAPPSCFEWEICHVTRRKRVVGKTVVHCRSAYDHEYFMHDIMNNASRSSWCSRCSS
jgi:hypothetical protein